MFQGQPALPTDRYRSAGAVVFTLVLVAYIVATRWPLAPKYLYYFDSANFALSLERFNPAMHQPQPPGYAMFVGLIRLIHMAVRRPENVLLIAGLLGACAATMLIRVAADDLFGGPAGLLASAVLASNPVFWFAGLTNQIRIFLSVSALTVATLAWRALTRPERPGWFYGSFAALGVAAGFRPDAAMLLVPLLIWVWRSNRYSIRCLAAGVGLLATTAAPWAMATVLAVGGPGQFGHLLWGYADVQSQGTSAFFGARAGPALAMFKEAAAWNFLGAVAWIWAVPFLPWRQVSAEVRRKVTFLVLGFLPPFLFSALIHIGDPDQALASISFACLAGGGVLGAAFRQTRGKRVFACAAGIVVLQSLLFFLPPGKLARASSFRTVAAVDRMNTGAIRAVELLKNGGPVTIVHYGSLVSSRQLSYYFPEDYVVVLPGKPGSFDAGSAPQVFQGHHPAEAPEGAAGPIRSGSRRILCLLPFDARPGDLPGWRQSGPVFYLDLTDQQPVTIGPYRFVYLPR